MIEPPSLSAIRSPTSAQPERALKVDADDLIEELLARLGGRRGARGHPRVVDQHVDPPELPVRGVDEPVDVGPATNVRRHR
jgi:hypothetical protein